MVDWFQLDKQFCKFQGFAPREKRGGPERI